MSTDKSSQIIQQMVDAAPEAEKYCTDGYGGYFDVVFPGNHISNIHNKNDKRSYLNKAICLMRTYFDKMASLEDMKFLHKVYRSEVFPMLDAVSLPIDYFYDRRVGEWYKMICEKSLEEILFDTVKGYGAETATAVLRFPVPYQMVAPQSKVIMVGDNLAARYWVAQLILSNYCKVVGWFDTEQEIPTDLHYDNILTAKL